MIISIPLFAIGQDLSTVKGIDSIVSLIDNDSRIIKKLYDTVTYEKEDGGTNWDSVYHHKEFFYKNGELVKITAWNKYGNLRNDMLAYYKKGKTIKFSKGESFKGQSDYGRLNFAIYYYQDKDLSVEWLTPKPDNVLGIATDIFLIWSYSLQKEER
jgi:hypothetical protein